MTLYILALLTILSLLLGMLLFAEVGRRIGIARLAQHSRLPEGVGAAEGAVFALLGLLIAFAFSGAADRFMERRHLITVEANAIGTAYLRIDLMPADAQSEMRDLFRRYLDSRLRIGQAAGDEADEEASLAESGDLQLRIWSKAVAASEREGVMTSLAMLLPALNDMIDITTTRLIATRDHPPPILFALLGVFSLIGALLVGFSGSVNKDRSLFHTLAYSTVLSLTIYVVVDLEFPRLGLIRVDSADQVLVDLRRSMD